MIRRYLPYFIRRRLWGDRERWGVVADTNDTDWHEWQHAYGKFYDATQRTGVGTRVNDAGYRVMEKVSLAGKTVLEIGAGDIRHDRHWRDRPDAYVLADVDAGMMDRAVQRLEAIGVPHRKVLIERGASLPLADASVDMVVSFYSLEHLYPLQPYLEEFARVLKPGGEVVGAIPAEGGLGWGLGRFLTSRRWFLNNTTIDPDKIICWEHPNFADGIIDALNERFSRKLVSYWPIPWFPVLDTNLILRFHYVK